MSSEKFWLGIWMIVGGVILGIISLVGGCVTKNTEMSNSVVTSAVQKGLDPMVAKCAMLIGQNNVSAAETAICLSVTNKK
jgi:hypothetical protein